MPVTTAGLIILLISLLLITGLSLTFFRSMVNRILNRKSPELVIRLNAGCRILPEDTPYGSGDYVIAHIRNLGDADFEIENVLLRISRISDPVLMRLAFARETILKPGRSLSFLVSQDEAFNGKDAGRMYVTVSGKRGERVYSCTPAGRLLVLLGWR